MYRYDVATTLNYLSVVINTRHHVVEKMTSDINTVNSLSLTTSRPEDAADVAMVTTDAVNDVAATTALMVACENEDINEVRKLLSADQVGACVLE